MKYFLYYNFIETLFKMIYHMAKFNVSIRKIKFTFNPAKKKHLELLSNSKGP